MKTKFSHTLDGKSMVHRPLRKSVLPLLTFAPVLTLAVANPGIAFADDAMPQEDSIPHGVLTLCDDPFSYDGGSSYNEEANFYDEISFDTYDGGSAISNESSSQSDAIEQGANEASTNKGQMPYSYELAHNDPSDSYMIAENSNFANSSNSISNSANALSSNSDRDGSNSNNLANLANRVNSASLNSPNFANSSTRSFLSASNIGTQSSIVVDPNIPSGTVTVYDPHHAVLSFTVTKGGTISQDAKASVSAGDGVQIVTQTYDNSLMGTSPTVIAVPDAGYHFVAWIDTETNKTLSTKATYAPDRPASGWPENWVIQAVFELDVYQIILDPNGGTSIGGGGGGGSGGAIYLGEVVPGSEFQIPENGSSFTFAKAGSTFTGWNLVARPGSKNGSGFAISDGQVIDKELEQTLQDQGYLVTGKNTPTLTFYAQWVASEVAIEYATASTGGAVALYSDRRGSGASYTKETLKADTGIHPDKNVSAGPEGAVAIPSTGYHFTGWRVIDSQKQLTEYESTNSTLTPTVVSRISYYPDSVPNVSEYHPVNFTASFAPNTYKVAYDANGGSGYADSFDYVYGTSATTTASGGFTRDGYELTGWNLKSNGGSYSLGLGSTFDSSTINSIVGSGAVADNDNARVTLYAQWRAIATPEPDPDPDPEPTPDPEPNPSPSPDPYNPSGSGDTPVPTPSNISEGVSNAVADTVDAIARIAASNSSSNANASTANAATAGTGLLASLGKSDKAGSAAGPLVVFESYSDMTGSSFAGTGNDNSILSSLMSPEGLQEAGTTVAAVAAVGALASLVGVGVSVAGAALVGAATIGTASAVGLSSAADLAADLAVASAAGGAAAGAASKRKRREEDGSEEKEEIQS